MPSWIIANNQVLDQDGNINVEKDKEAARLYMIDYVNSHTRFFHSLKEKLNYLIENDYYEQEFLDAYTYEQIKEVFDIAYDAKFRFPSYMGAFKFYNDYALKSRDDSKTILERYEDRLSIVALYHANGDFELAKQLIKSLIAQDFTPATPTLLNTGRSQRGEFVSCFLLEVEDSLNAIARNQEFAMQLSKIGGGVALNLTNLRAKGESIKKQPGVAKGVVGVAKLLDNAFRYADQMGQRQGAGAVYLSAFHADIEDFLATKKINVDEDFRLKTLSLGVSVPNKLIELAKEDKGMYLFYPHTVYEEYGIPFADISADMDSWYDKLVENPNVRKRKINPRRLLNTMAQLQGESGYPYIFFADNVNNKKANPVNKLVKFSNLCTEILQRSEATHYEDYHNRANEKIGLDISCNLSSGHMGNMIKNNSIEETVNAAMTVMTSVSHNTNINHVPGVKKANDLMRSVGFGMMGHHGFIAEKFISFGSEEDIDLLDVFFNAVNYYTLKYSMEMAKETGEKFFEFEDSHYADGSYFDGRGAIYPKTEIVKEIFADINLPTEEDWEELRANVMEHGLYHAYRLAIAPNGSSGYLMSATPSMTPIKQLIEERTYGNSKTYYPMPGAGEYGFMYQDMYEMDKFHIIDAIATIQRHVDQGISFELGVRSDATTRELQRYWLYAQHKGIKTLYYTRTRKMTVDECLACQV